VDFYDPYQQRRPLLIPELACKVDAVPFEQLTARYTHLARENVGAAV